MKILLVGGLGNQLFQITNAHILNRCEVVTYQPYFDKDQAINFKKLSNHLLDFDKYFHEENISSSFLVRKITNLSIRVGAGYSKGFLFTYKNITIGILEIINNIFLDRSSRTLIVKGTGLPESTKNVSKLRIIGYLQSKKLLIERTCTCGFIARVISSLNSSNENKNHFSRTAIHIRLGDYVSDRKFVQLDSSYFETAILYLEKLHDIESVDLYSNNQIEAKNYLQNRSDIQIRFPTDSHDSGIKVLQSISKHKNIIISNSTLSWWAAFVNNHDDQVIVAPRLWFSKKNLLEQSLLLDSWVVI